MAGKTGQLYHPHKYPHPFTKHPVLCKTLQIRVQFSVLALSLSLYLSLGVCLDRDQTELWDSVSPLFNKTLIEHTHTGTEYIQYTQTHTTVFSMLHKNIYLFLQVG